ncbi:ClpP/crotonase [Epithele typhae]|uniref:ClpP/crotonase n=1 Tax=Epithele typhae TaxID=378194 RepID=UPI002008BD6E|nr:ClpP/crotonase [Epithele typhae]KAH9945289.1 ClpP/crotonase [Epithele typhae]
MSYPARFPADSPSITVTNPSPSTWVIEMHNGADNRMTEKFITHGLLPALDTVERHWRENWRAGVAKKQPEMCHGALMIVGNRKQDKFFSNGLDWDNLIKDPNFTVNFFPLVFNPLMVRLMTFPIPVIAVVNGHGFAGGMGMAMACDYRVMFDGSKRNSWLSMNEIHFGAQIPTGLMAVLQEKAPSPNVYRKIVLEGHRFTPKEALGLGLVDKTSAAADTETLLAEAGALASTLAPLAKSGAWGVNKREMYRTAIRAIGRDTLPTSVRSEDAAAKARL